MWGRKTEVNLLRNLQKKSTSSLVVMTGRRRIGKSTLVQHYGKEFNSYYFEFSGLAPHPKQTNQDQLDHFLKQIKKQFHCKCSLFSDWGSAFAELNLLLKKYKKRTVVLFDEISWMGAHDPEFSGLLKIAWDNEFKHHKELNLVLCGSVSTWIQKNILNSTNFLGRVSLSIQLKELPLSVVNQFWGRKAKLISDSEKIKLLCVLGCVPKYLEEVQPHLSAEENIKQLCFDQNGFLYDEFNKIFSDIFQKKSELYKKIILCLVDQKRTATEIAKKIKIQLSSDLLENLNNLIISGFVQRDYGFSANTEVSKESHYRLSDNYLRFSLKYIGAAKIKNDKNLLKKNSSSLLDHLPNWSSIAGLQFENLVFNHIDEVIEGLKINKNEVLQANPYSQKKTTRNKGACQIDLILKTKDNTLFICELKFKKLIQKDIIKDVDLKIKKLKKIKGYSYRPVLIYQGELDVNDRPEIEKYFSRILKLSDLL